MTLSQIEHIENLLITYQRSLNILREQKAQLGITVPPAIVIQIENLIKKIDDLQYELTQLKAPLIYIHNFGDRPEVPPGATELEWGKHFAFGEPYRTVPDEQTWRTLLIPELEKLREDFGHRGLIRLRTTGALSVGFAFGYTFREVGQYKLEVAQFPPFPPPFWYSNEPPPANTIAPRFTVRQTANNTKANDLVVIVYATPGRSPQSVCRAVADYFDEEDGFEGLFRSDDAGAPKKLKGVLLLESEAAAKEERFINGWEAAALARSSRRLVIDVISQVKPERVNLFLAVPFGLATFLGHQWNAIGKPVQCYEWIGSTTYKPACLLNMS